MAQFRPADVIAFLLIIGYIGLSILGKNETLTSSILLVVGFYFGREHVVSDKE